MGVIGVGNMCEDVVRRAVAFGMKIIGTDLREMAVAFITETGVKMVPMEDLFE